MNDPTPIPSPQRCASALGLVLIAGCAVQVRTSFDTQSNDAPTPSPQPVAQNPPEAPKAPPPTAPALPKPSLPSASDPVERHLLNRCIEMPPRGLSHHEVQKLFVTGAKELFVFIQEEAHDSPYTGRTLQRGEAVLVIDAFPEHHNPERSKVKIMLIEGATTVVRVGEFSTSPLAGGKVAPTDGTVFDPIARTLEGHALTDWPGFADLFSKSDDRKAAFENEYEKYRDCFFAQMKKLDPDDRASDYNLVQQSAQGTRIEGLYAHYARKAERTCHEKERRREWTKLETTVFEEYHQQKYEEIREAATRLNALFGGAI
jgi:hypothetical protein